MTINSLIRYHVYLLISTDSSDDGRLSSTESTDSGDGDGGKLSSSGGNALASDSSAKPDDGVGRSCKDNLIVFMQYNLCEGL